MDEFSLEVLFVLAHVLPEESEGSTAETARVEAAKAYGRPSGAALDS